LTHDTSDLHPLAGCPPRAAYVHIPFCLSKCHYCDFSSVAGRGDLFGPYVDALVVEIQRAANPEAELDCVYVGGGTPSLLPTEEIVRIIDALKSSFPLSPRLEATIEANPGTVTERKLVELSGTYFNRLSLGVQSFDDRLLARLGRAHTADEAVAAYRQARDAGFENINIDLIYALPEQTLRDWEASLRAAIDLGPEHVSLYELTIEEGTRFARECSRGELAPTDEDVRIDMHQLALLRLADAGYEQYEVSNFARPGFRCRHNQVYWRNEPYFGFGAGATSYVDGLRAHRISNPEFYITAVNSETDIFDFSERLGVFGFVAESLMLGLRTMDGVDVHNLSALTRTDVYRYHAQVIERLVRRGLLIADERSLRATPGGLLVLDDITAEFAEPAEDLS